MSTFKQVKRKIKYTLIYYAVKGLIASANLVPRKIWLSLCGGLGTLAGWCAVHQRKLAVKHLTLAFGNEKTKKRNQSALLSGVYNVREKCRRCY
jgi:lauroyl/myristoyl acyltransferase